MTETQQMGTRISAQLYRELQELAEREHMSVNSLVVEAIKDVLRKYARRRDR